MYACSTEARSCNMIHAASGLLWRGSRHGVCLNIMIIEIQQFLLVTQFRRLPTQFPVRTTTLANSGTAQRSALAL